MKRSQIESQIRELQARLKRDIEAKPIPAFFVAMLIGAVLILMRAIFFPLIIIFAVILLGFWYFADKDLAKVFNFDDRDSNPPQPPPVFPRQEVPKSDTPEQ